MALTEVAARRAEPEEVLGRLDALGDDPEPQTMCELDGRVDDRLVASIRLHAGDERPVDLEDVCREVLELTERGVSDAEVVDGYANALVDESLEHLARAHAVGEQNALRDLELEPRRVDAMLGERLSDLVGEPRIREVAT